MSWNFTDLTGKRFGRLTVLQRGETINKKIHWLCRCDCGNMCNPISQMLKSGYTQSCGCLQRERTSKSKLCHGKCATQIYSVWSNIKARCYKKNNKAYQRYGGRNIVMCDEWKNNFQAFYNWSINNGYKEEKLPNGCNKLTIDRIDNNKGYSPDNCRWVDRFVQANNTRANYLITYKGKTQTLKQCSKELNFDYMLVFKRLEAGWDFETAVSVKIKNLNIRHKKYEYQGEVLSMAEVARRCGINKWTLQGRLKRGWTLERAVSEPLKLNNKKAR